MVGRQALFSAEIEMVGRQALFPRQKWNGGTPGNSPRQKWNGGTPGNFAGQKGNGGTPGTVIIIKTVTLSTFNTHACDGMFLILLFAWNWIKKKVKEQVGLKATVVRRYW